MVLDPQIAVVLVDSALNSFEKKEFYNINV